jgi:hypothetical protein
LYPVVHIVEFETPHETGNERAELICGRIELLQAIRLPRDEKGRLADLRAFPSGGQIEMAQAPSIMR